ncbi:hypothetical protein VTK73DRAFT_5242 [Phialemonium thermophilum]|uniref:Extracellular mutant protein 11 C-terminal domain-containing protein n=1 Tax=Phialemonium thermophilum TaxID=223376 RepID=A0ABR3WP36_9PEZI
MRLSMMPTAKKKMGSMGMFVSRHVDTPVNSPAPGPTSPRAGVATPAPPAPSFSLQPAAQIAAVSRQDAVAAAKLPVPRTGRFAPPSQPPSTISSPPHQHYHPMQRSRPVASDGGRNNAPAQPPSGGIWEDSTVASMFDDSDSRGGSDRHIGQHGRHYSESAFARQHPYQRQHSHDDHLPFVIGENGMLKVVSQPVAAANGPSAAPLYTGAQSSINEHLQPTRLDSHPVYADEPKYEPQTPPKTNSLRRTRLPHRDARDTRDAKRNSFVDRPEPVLAVNTSLDGSPGRSSDRSDRFIDTKLGDAVREREQREQRERDRQREHELAHKRSTVFENLTPIEDPVWTTAEGPVGVVPTAEVTPEELREALQRTPRPSRPPPISQSSKLQSVPLVRTSSRRSERASTRKRRLSLDYNDAELNAMDYDSLRQQAFDFDPQTAALQQTAVPTGDSLEDKLEHYKDKDSLEQHQFFTHISIQEWEDAGDWFLGQFSAVVQKMKEARKSKRAMIAKFEAEIAAREEAVRGKIEGIGRTLQELKQEGQNMMQGKDVDV